MTKTSSSKSKNLKMFGSDTMMVFGGTWQAWFVPSTRNRKAIKRRVGGRDQNFHLIGKQRLKRLVREIDDTLTGWQAEHADDTISHLIIDPYKLCLLFLSGRIEKTHFENAKDNGADEVVVRHIVFEVGDVPTAFTVQVRDSKEILVIVNEIGEQTVELTAVEAA